MKLLYFPSGYRRASILVLGTGAAFLVAPVTAADFTWDGGGGDTNWSTDENWAGDIGPSAGDSLIFDSVAGLNATNDFTAETSFKDISFAAGAGAFTLGGNSILLGGNLSNQSTLAQNVGVGLTLGGGQHVITGSTSAGATLALGNIGAGSSGGVAVFAPGSGTITTTTANSNDILGGWASVGTGTGAANWATVNGSNEIVAFSGYTSVALNAAIVSSASSNVLISGDATAGTGVTDINTLKSSSVVGTGGNDITIGTGGTLRFGVSGGILHDNAVANNMRIGSNTTGVGNNTITAGGPVSGTAGTLYLNTAASASSHNNVLGILGTIADNGAGGTVTVVKTGLSSAYFDAGNSYSGGTYIQQGHIQGNRATSFGTGAIHVSAGGQAYLNATATFANDLYISGTGLPADNTGAVRLSAATVTGLVTLEGDSRININGNTTANLNGKITGGYALEFYATGSGNAANFVLGNTGNDYTGNIALNSTASNHTATLRLSSSEVIAHGAGKGNLILNASGSGTASASLDLNGNNETVNGLVSAGAGARTFVQNNATGTAATLTLGAGNASGSFGGTIRNNTSGTGTVAVKKTGTGTQTLSGTNNYTGATIVQAGTLVMNGSLAAGTTTTVGTTGAIAGNGTFNGAVLIEGTHSPGNSAGTQVMAGGVSYAMSSTLDWELATNTTNLGFGPVNYDQVQVTGGALAVEIGAKIDLIFDMVGSTVDFTDDFWDSQQNWTVVALSGTAAAGLVNNAFSIDEISLDSNGLSHGSFGSFSNSVDGGGNHILTWTPMPEPATAMLAAIGAVSLARRRRRVPVRA